MLTLPKSLAAFWRDESGFLNFVAAALPAVAGAFGASKSAKATKKAAQIAAAQAEAASQRELAFQQQARDKADQVYAPYSKEGAAARRMYNAAMGVDTMSGGVGGDTLAAARADYDRNFEASPFMGDARYGAEQALNALRSTYAATGQGISGKMQRAASDIQQGYRAGATQNYLASLGGIADAGGNADRDLVSTYQGFANNSSNAVRSAAAQQGQYGMMGAQAGANAASDIAGYAGDFLGYYQSSRTKPIGSVAPVKAFSYKTPSYTGKIRSAAQSLPALRGGG